MPLEDDDDARTAESVPNPDDRLWRHPSELAKGATIASAARTEVGGLGAGTRAVAVMAMAAGVIYLSWNLVGPSGGRSAPHPSPDQAASATTLDAAALSAITQPEAVERAIRGRSADSTTEAGDGPDDGTPPPTIELNPPEPGELEPYAGQAIGPLLKSSSQETIQERQMGLFDSRAGGEPLARIIAHDGFVITSASALDGRKDLSLWDLDEWVRAQVVALDRLSDIAVLEPETWTSQLQTLADQLFVGTAPAPDSASTNSEQPASETGSSQAGLGTAPSGLLGRTVVVRPTTRLSEAGGNRRAGTEPVVGTVVVAGERVVHRGGRALYNAYRTTIHFEPSLAGGRLLDDEGRTVAMIVNSDSWSLTALPLESVLEIATSLRSTGRVGTSWIGLETETDDSGVVRVAAVDENGPSHELLRPGDVITSWNRRPVVDSDHLIHLVRRTAPNEPIEIGVERQGSSAKLELTPTPVAVNG